MEVRIGKKQRPQSRDYSLVPCPRRDKGDMIYIVYSIIAFGVNGRAQCSAIERLLRQSFAGCAVGRVLHARITGTEVSWPARLLRVTPRSRQISQRGPPSSTASPPSFLSASSSVSS